jgi:phosphatidylserine synthase
MLSRARAWGQANAWINLVFAVGWAFLAIGNVFWGHWWFTVVLGIGAVLFVAQWLVVTSGREPRDSPSFNLVAAVGSVILVIVVMIEGPWWLAVVFGVSAVVAAAEWFRARRRRHGHA